MCCLEKKEVHNQSYSSISSMVAIVLIELARQICNTKATLIWHPLVYIHVVYVLLMYHIEYACQSVYPSPSPH